MSSIYRIHGARFLRKYTAAERTSAYAYMSDVRKIADTLCKVPWTRVGGDVQATMTLHTEEGLDWNDPERDRFDAAEWCADHSDGMHRAYAQAACYVFELPDSAIGTAIEKVGVTVTSDPYNPYGARISALTSDTLTIPMDCATVRTGDMHRAPDENGMGAAPRLYVTNSDGSQTWYANTEAVELEPAATLLAKKYLFVFVCLENYNRGRDGWIEGSSYIENDVSLTLADACADLVAAELNDCSDIADDSAEFNVAKGGIYQSNAGNVSGVFGVEVLKNGDSLDDMAYSPERVPALSEVISNVADHVVKITGSNPANVKFIPMMYCTHTIATPYHWQFHVLAIADALFWGGAAYGRSGGKVVRVFSIDGSNETKVIEFPDIQDSDAAAGIAFAWIEGRQNGNIRIVHIYTKNNVELTSATYGPAGQPNTYWYHNSTTHQSSRTTGVQIPVCVYNNAPIYLGSNSITGTGLPASIPFSGTVTSVKNLIIPDAASYTGSESLIISGNLVSVGGVPVRNCAIVTFSGSTAVVTRPSWDTLITPDTYDNFAVSPNWPLLTDGDTATYQHEDCYFVTGSFTKLSGGEFSGCAKIDSSGSISGFSLSGSTDILSSLSSFTSIDGGRYFYQGSVYDIVHVYPHDQITRAVGVTAEESCIGMRALYAKLFMGSIKPIYTPSVGTERFGVGFTVSSATKTILSYDGSGVSQSTSVPVYRLSMASLAVPFSTPVDYVARKIRLDWESWSGTATGGRFNVWLLRGKYVDELPGDVLSQPDIYVGTAKGVGEWEYLGLIDASDGEVTSRVFALTKWLDQRLATIMLTAYVSMDQVNPSSEMTLPQGVVTEFYADPNVGEVTGGSSLWKPDITLIG